MNTHKASQNSFVLLTEAQAAEFLNFTSRALQAWRIRGNGPKFVRISSRAIRYQKCDLQNWIDERIKSSTSET